MIYNIFFYLGYMGWKEKTLSYSSCNKETFKIILHWFKFNHFRGNIFSNIQKNSGNVRNSVKAVRGWITIHKKKSILSLIISFRSSNLFLTEFMFRWPIITLNILLFLNSCRLKNETPLSCLLGKSEEDIEFNKLSRFFFIVFKTSI